MNHSFRTVVTLLLAAFAVASCDKLKPPLKLPLPQTVSHPHAEQAPMPKASVLRAAVDISPERTAT